MDNNRAQLLDDAFVVASAHLLPYKSALDLTLYLKNEKDYVPWNAVLSELNYIDTMLYNVAQYPDWKVCQFNFEPRWEKYESILYLSQIHLTDIVTPYYNSVGFQESSIDSHFTVYSRIDAMNWACKLQVVDCVDNSKAKYAELMSDPDNSQ